MDFPEWLSLQQHVFLITRRHWDSCSFDKSVVFTCCCLMNKSFHIVFKPPQYPDSLYGSPHYPVSLKSPRFIAGSPRQLLVFHQIDLDWARKWISKKQTNIQYVHRNSLRVVWFFSSWETRFISGEISEFLFPRSIDKHSGFFFMRLRVPFVMREIHLQTKNCDSNGRHVPVAREHICRPRSVTVIVTFL